MGERLQQHPVPTALRVGGEKPLFAANGGAVEFECHGRAQHREAKCSAKNLQREPNLASQSAGSWGVAGCLPSLWSNDQHSEKEEVVNEGAAGSIRGELVLVIGSTGKIGRRVAEGLSEKGHAVRKGSRQSDPPFDWDDQGTWDAVLDGVAAAYISYAPDLAIPGAPDAVRAFVERAVEHGVRRLVLLSGRGEEEAQACELLIQLPDIEWTVVSRQLVLPELLRRSVL